MLEGFGARCGASPGGISAVTGMLRGAATGVWWVVDNESGSTVTSKKWTGSITETTTGVFKSIKGDVLTRVDSASGSGPIG